MGHAQVGGTAAGAAGVLLAPSLFFILKTLVFIQRYVGEWSECIRMEGRGRAQQVQLQLRAYSPLLKYHRPIPGHSIAAVGARKREARGPRQEITAPEIPQANPGSLYRCGRST